MKNPRIVDGQPMFDHECDDCKVSHTPTPWMAGQDKDGYRAIKPDLGKSYRDTIVTSHLSAEDAAFIVRVVNAYEKDQEIKKELLATLKMLRDGGAKEDSTAVWNKVEKAIAKAEGK